MALGACGSDDAPGVVEGDSGIDGGQPDPGIDGSHPQSDAGTDGGGSDGGGDNDAQAGCTPLQCTPAQGDAGFISSCRTTCNSLSTFCECGTNSAASCFCQIGNAAPSCLTGSFAECGGLVPSCNAPLASDPKNCGRCGHDCGDLACVQGVCQPKEVSLQGNQIHDWASNGTNLYIAMNDGVHIVPIDGLADGGAGQVIQGSGTTAAVSLDNTNVYFTNAGVLKKAPVGGVGAVVPMGSYSSSSAQTPHMLANDTENVYVAPAGRSVVYLAPKNGAVTVFITNPNDAQNVGPVGVDADRVYYLVTTNSGIVLRGVEKAATHTAWERPIQSDSVQDLVVQADGVYVAAGKQTGPQFQQVPTGAIWRVQLDGSGDPVPVLDHSLYFGVVAWLAAQGDDLFWIPQTTTSVGYVHTMPRSGGPSHHLALADSSYYPAALLVDSRYVYWTDGMSPATVRMLPRTYRP